MKRFYTPLQLLLLVFTISVFFAGVINAQQKGASKLMKPIASYNDVASLKDRDMVAMACPKCKTVTITYISTQKGHIKTTTPGEEHLCPGCEQKFVVVGGKPSTRPLPMSARSAAAPMLSAVC